MFESTRTDIDICNIDEQVTCKVNNNDKCIRLITSKDIYWNLIDENTIPPTCIKSWNDRLEITYDPKKWENIFLLPFQCTNDLKIKELQMKILHRFYPCQSLVAKWDKETSKICYLCNEDVANIAHTFWKCKVISAFWDDILQWLMPAIFQYTSNLDSEKILFGILPYTVGNHCVNHCLFYCKYHIHVQQLNKKKTTLESFKTYYRNVLEVEQALYVLRNEKKLFDNLFKRVVNIL